MRHFLSRENWHSLTAVKCQGVSRRVVHTKKTYQAPRSIPNRNFGVRQDKLRGKNVNLMSVKEILRSLYLQTHRHLLRIYSLRACVLWYIYEVPGMHYDDGRLEGNPLSSGGRYNDDRRPTMTFYSNCASTRLSTPEIDMQPLTVGLTPRKTR